MQFNNTQNEKVLTERGDVIWVSRAVAVCALIITEDDKALVTKRSDKVDHPGKWALPCGYVDWDESIHQALIREVYEEIGININGDYAVMYDINDNPNKDQRQNITFHFIIPIDMTSDELKQQIKLCDESVAFDFISKKDIANKQFGNREFAFNHDDRLFKSVQPTSYTPVHDTKLDIDKDSQF